MSKYHNDRTAASDPVAIRLANSKLRMLQPELFGWRSLFTTMRLGKRPLGAREIKRLLAEHLIFGDSRAAIVMRPALPLLAAAYSDELDAVILLEFPDFLAEHYSLRLGSRLLTVNTYGYGTTPRSALSSLQIRIDRALEIFMPVRSINVGTALFTR